MRTDGCRGPGVPGPTPCTIPHAEKCRVPTQTKRWGPSNCSCNTFHHARQNISVEDGPLDCHPRPTHRNKILVLPPPHVEIKLDRVKHPPPEHVLFGFKFQCPRTIKQTSKAGVAESVHCKGNKSHKKSSLEASVSTCRLHFRQNRNN